MMSEKNNKRIKLVKQKLCQKLIDGDTTVEILIVAEKEILSENKTENYYQAEAIKQAIDWYEKL